MTTKNIQLSIIAAFLFILNALFYYCFNQIAFVINYSHRTYPAKTLFNNQPVTKTPVFTADLGKLLFPSAFNCSAAVVETIANASPVSTIENTQISTLNNAGNATTVQTVNVKAGEHIKNLISPIQPSNKLSLGETAKVNPTDGKADVPAENITPGDDAMEVINVPPVKKITGHTNNTDVNNIPVMQSVSKDGNVAGKTVMINGQNLLMVYPTNTEWREMFVILSLTSVDKVSLQSIVAPDFDGVVYPSLQKGELELHGTKYKVTLVKLKGHNATPSYPYFLSLASSSSFYIFGDYSDKSKWYIYENNQVTQFISSSEIHLF